MFISEQSGYSRKHKYQDLLGYTSYAVMIFGFLAIYLIGKNIDDGTYCAKIKYYNPNTEKESTYYLPVTVAENKLVKIHWSNGGWLDETHFKPPKVRNKSASFTSDKGYDYEVKILNKDDKCDDY